MFSQIYCLSQLFANSLPLLSVHQYDIHTCVNVNVPIELKQTKINYRGRGFVFFFDNFMSIV